MDGKVGLMDQGDDMLYGFKAGIEGARRFLQSFAGAPLRFSRASTI